MISTSFLFFFFLRSSFFESRIERNYTSEFRTWRFYRIRLVDRICEPVCEDCLWKFVESRKDKGTDPFHRGKGRRKCSSHERTFPPQRRTKAKGEETWRSHTASIFSITAICLRLLIPREREKNLCKYVAKRTKWFFDHVKVIFRVARVIYADGNT